MSRQHEEAERLHGWQALAYQLGHLLDRVELSGEAVALLTSLVVGLGTGFAAILFNLLIRQVTQLSFEWLPRWTPGSGRAYLLLAPVLGGLLAGPLIYRFAREAKGHGVPEVMQAIALRGGRIRPQVAAVKALASSLTIGTGGSVGREGPIVQIGAALGSTVGQALRLSDDRIRNLVACGAAGGIAATFNAPIAGVIFALEVILGEVSVSHVGSVVISAVTASSVMWLVSGSEFAFPVPEPYTIVSGWEYGIYAVLGVLAALVATLFVRSLYWSEDLFEHQKLFPGWLQPAVGGLLLGALAVAYPLVAPALQYEGVPQIFGGGYAPITQALAGRETLMVALGLLLLKMMATNLTLGSGGSGGIFAPSLFMGAMLGVAVGIVANRVFPDITAPPGAYALVGMGAVFAGAAHAPVTAVVMLFELTGDYRIILPLMLAVVVAMVVARGLLGGESIYTLKLARRGIRLARGRDIDVLQSVNVGEIMTRNVYTIPADMTLVELSETFSRERHHGFPLIAADGSLWGIVTISDLERAIGAKLPRQTPVTAFATPYSRLQMADPNEPMGAALRRMSTRGLGHLPVVDPSDDRRRLLGMLRREDVVRAYDIALTRRAELEHRQKRMALHNIDGTEFVELRLKEGDGAVGKTLQQVALCLPAECVLISVRRASHVVIPHGDTVFRVGDLITAFARSEDVPQLHMCLEQDGEADSAAAP